MYTLAKFDNAATEALREAYKRIVLRMRAMRTTTLAFYVSQALVLTHVGESLLRILAGAELRRSEIGNPGVDFRFDAVRVAEPELLTKLESCQSPTAA